MESEEYSFKEDNLKFYFVINENLKDVGDVSDDMRTAFSNIREYFEEEESIKWIKWSDCLALPKRKLTKRDIFILQEFAGEAFEFLQTTKSLIIGPRCMLSCLMDNSSVPLGKSPVFTTAMRNLTICASGLSISEKTKIKNLVSWMGGYYNDDLSMSCTHLVSNTIKSNKYENAALNNIPIMHTDWVSAVWEKSKRENILATSKQFEKYKLPIFFNLNITTSGLSTEKKNLVMKLVNENGGIYVGAFKSSKTDILITEKDKGDTPKYRAAIQYKKECLLPEWITDSVKKGYALSTLNYKIVGMKVSTPTKLSQTLTAADFNPDCTELSLISHIGRIANSCTINETVCSTASSSNEPYSCPKSQLNTGSQKNYKFIFEKIALQQAKKSGAFLDGCCVYLCGFSTDEKEQLNKILNCGGATRFDQVNDKITHIIAGEPTTREIQSIKENGILANVLTLNWLLESIKLKQTATEEDFIYQAKIPALNEPEPPSPSTKKNIQSMNHSFKKPTALRTRLDFSSKQQKEPPRIENLIHDEDERLENKENELLSQYMAQDLAVLPELPKSVPKSIVSQRKIQSGPESSESDTGLCTEEYENLTFFTNLSVYIHDHDDELYQELKLDCENAGGKVVERNYIDTVDYVIVPSDTATDVNGIPVKAKNIVNNFWIEDAMRANKLVDIEYYHAAIPLVAEQRPLEGLTIVISIYAANERLFIESLSTILGAIKNDSYARKQYPLLICSADQGNKYNAALKWDFPVVTSDWLVNCAKHGTRVDMEPYLVGDSIISEQWRSIFAKEAAKSSSDTSTGSVDKNTNIKAKNSNKVEQMTPQPMRRSTRQSNKGKLDENASSNSILYTELRSTESSSRNEHNHNTEIFTKPKTPEETINQRKSSSSETESSDRDTNIGNGHDELDYIAKLTNKKKSSELSVRAEHFVENLSNSVKLKHRRLSELVDLQNHNRRNSLLASPPASGLNISDFVKEVSTPNRETVYNVLKEMENRETPQSQRLRMLAVTPSTNSRTPPTPRMPEFVTTPEIEKRRLENLDKYYLPVPKKNRRQSTPLSEIKKKFWRDALGDQYFEEGNYNTQTFTSSDDDLYSAIKPSKSVQSGGETQNLVATNIHLKNLSDFIKNRDAEKKTIEHEEEFDTAPQKYDSEMMGGTEQMVVWRDPTEFVAARRSKSNNMHYVGTPCFSMSVSNEMAKQKMIELIKNLKGKVCENLSSFDPACTHIICEKPNRGEKILSCIASGKWVLTLNYIEDSAQAGHFLQEEEYEWGNPKLSSLNKLEDNESTIAKAAFRWRTKIASHSEFKLGAFHGFRVILHVPNKEQFQTLITAGGGIVLFVDTPYSNSKDALSATHCFVDTKKSKLSKEDHKKLAESGVLVLSILYLNAYLTRDIMPDRTKFILSI